MLRSIMWWLLTCLHSTACLCMVVAPKVRQTLWKGLADLCHRYAKKKLKRPRYSKKVCEVLEQLSKMGSATLPVVLRPFLTSIQCEIAPKPSVVFYHCQSRHQSEMAINARHLWDTSGNSSEAMPGFESLQPEKGASAAEAWREWQKLQGLKPYGNHKRLIGFIMNVWW